MKVTERQLEASARAVMSRMGFESSSHERLIDVEDNPRVREWVEIARAALTARPPPLRRVRGKRPSA